MRELRRVRGLIVLAVQYIFIFVVLCFLIFQRGDKVSAINVSERETKLTYSSVDCRPLENRNFIDENGQYAMQGRRSPIYDLPADDEKNVGVINRRDILPVYPKEVYLTFDDGPSEQNTMKILDILNKSGVKASFFIVGSAAERNRKVVEKLTESGMCILPHSYSHKYSIYRNPTAYFEDLDKNIAVIEGMTGRKALPFVRMPGGSANTAAKGGNTRVIKAELKDKGIRYVDWNVSSLDAAGVTMDTDIIKAAVVNSCRDLKFAVVLMHDAPTKTTTVLALPEIIKYLKDSGYVFRTFQDITPQEVNELIKRRIIDG